MTYAMFQIEIENRKDKRNTGLNGLKHIRSVYLIWCDLGIASLGTN